MSLLDVIMGSRESRGAELMNLFIEGHRELFTHKEIIGLTTSTLVNGKYSLVLSKMVRGTLVELYENEGIILAYVRNHLLDTNDDILMNISTDNFKDVLRVLPKVHVYTKV